MAFYELFGTIIVLKIGGRKMNIWKYCIIWDRIGNVPGKGRIYLEKGWGGDRCALQPRGGVGICAIAHLHIVTTTHCDKYTIAHCHSVTSTHCNIVQWIVAETRKRYAEGGSVHKQSQTFLCVPFFKLSFLLDWHRAQPAGEQMKKSSLERGNETGKEFLRQLQDSIWKLTWELGDGDMPSCAGLFHSPAP
jgi:hypothetical protein